MEMSGETGNDYQHCGCYILCGVPDAWQELHVHIPTKGIDVSAA